MKDAKIIKMRINNENIEFQLSYAKANIDMPDGNEKLNAITKYLTTYGNDMSRYTFDKADFSIGTLGLNYTYANFIFNSEIAQIEIKSMMPDMIAYYTLFGYRYENITPFFIYAKNKNDKKHFDTSGIHTPDATSKQLKKDLDDFLYLTNTSQKSISIGLRYDIKPGLAFKCQIDKITTSNYGSITKNGIDVSGYERSGITSRYKNISNKPIYQYIMGINFAF
jgi:hypothetical protein